MPASWLERRHRRQKKSPALDWFDRSPRGRFLR
jgi:hypothetical protein